MAFPVFILSVLCKRLGEKMRIMYSLSRVCCVSIWQKSQDLIIVHTIFEWCFMLSAHTSEVLYNHCSVRVDVCVKSVEFIISTSLFSLFGWTRHYSVVEDWHETMLRGRVGLVLKVLWLSFEGGKLILSVKWINWDHSLFSTLSWSKWYHSVVFHSFPTVDSVSLKIKLVHL